MTSPPPNELKREQKKRGEHEKSVAAPTLTVTFNGKSGKPSQYVQYNKLDHVCQKNLSTSSARISTVFVNWPLYHGHLSILYFQESQKYVKIAKSMTLWIKLIQRQIDTEVNEPIKSVSLERSRQKA